MANIALRNPQFKYIETIGRSVVCEVTIDGTLRYTLTKNLPVVISSTTQTINFDIAELARDYIEIEYQTDYVPQTVDIITVIKGYTLINGGGIVKNTVTYTDRGFEAYGTFEDGASPEVPFRSLPS